MSLQHCLVLTVATGAVWMDLRTRRIANEWIITAWIAGLVTPVSYTHLTLPTKLEV